MSKLEQLRQEYAKYKLENAEIPKDTSAFLSGFILQQRYISELEFAMDTFENYIKKISNEFDKIVHN